MELLSLSNIPPMQVSVSVSPTQTAQEMKLQWQIAEAVVWKNILLGCSKTLCLVYGRKGRLGNMANTLTFTSLILRMTLGI